MRIIRLYIVKEFLVGFFLTLVFFIGLSFLGNLFKLSDLIIRKNLPLEFAWKFFILGLPSTLALGFPLSSLLGCILSLGRMSQDNEILAIKTAGTKFLRLVLPLIIIGVILSLISFILFFETIPHSLFAQRNLFRKVGKLSPASLFEPGSFINAFKDTLVFVYNVRGNNIYNIFIYRNERGKTRTIFSKKARFILMPQGNKIKLKLSQGVSDEIDPKNPDKFYKMNFKTLFLTLEMKNTETPGKRPKDMTWKELTQNLKGDLQSLPYRIEVSKRLNMALWPLVFVILGAGLSQRINIKSKSLNFCLGFIIMGLFYIFFLFMQGLSIQNKIDPPISFTIPSLTGIILGAWLMKE